MDHIAHIKNTGGLDNESVTKKQSASIVRKLLCWLVVIQPRSIWKVQFSFLLYYMTQES